MLYYWTHDAVVHSEKVCECKSIEHPKPRERSFSHENRHFLSKKKKKQIMDHQIYLKLSGI